MVTCEPSPRHRPAGPPPAGPAAAGLFDRPLPVAVILGSFLAVGVPVGVAELVRPSGPVTWLYIWLLGMTHFVLTFTIYLNSANLRYFASDWRTVAVFFAAPVAILVGFDLLHAFRVGALFPVFAVGFWGLIRAFDFYHLNRQTFGVLQLFKRRSGAAFRPTLRRAENAQALVGVFLLMTTFLAGGVCPLALPGGWLTLPGVVLPDGGEPLLAPLDTLQAAWVGLALASVVLTAGIVAGLVRAGGPKGWTAAGYVGVQAAGVWAAAVFLPLYLAALAVHYVEYHVLMVPRCFRVPLDPDSRVDRAFGWVRGQPILFYALVAALAGAALAGSVAGMGMMGRSLDDLSKPFGYLAAIAVFDGIFVFHYFVEMYIWRFSDPHFRRALAGLYFAPAPVRAS